jgi:hypothetical protein
VYDHITALATLYLSYVHALYELDVDLGADLPPSAAAMLHGLSSRSPALNNTNNTLSSTGSSSASTAQSDPIVVANNVPSFDKPFSSSYVDSAHTMDAEEKSQDLQQDSPLSRAFAFRTASAASLEESNSSSYSPYNEYNSNSHSLFDSGASAAWNSASYSNASSGQNKDKVPRYMMPSKSSSSKVKGKSKTQ